MTPLMFAAAQGHFDCVKWLLENGAKILKRDKFKRNAVIMACRNGQLKVLSYLLQKY
jgi:FOG: Ankyrin repeat